MTTLICQEKIAPIVDLYCYHQGWLFKIFGGGLKRVAHIAGKNYMIYNVWKKDYNYLQHIFKELDLPS